MYLAIKTTDLQALYHKQYAQFGHTLVTLIPAGCAQGYSIVESYTILDEIELAEVPDLHEVAVPITLEFSALLTSVLAHPPVLALLRNRIMALNAQLDAPVDTIPVAEAAIPELIRLLQKTPAVFIAGPYPYPFSWAVGWDAARSEIWWIDNNFEIYQDHLDLFPLSTEELNKVQALGKTLLSAARQICAALAEKGHPPSQCTPPKFRP